MEHAPAAEQFLDDRLDEFLAPIRGRLVKHLRDQLLILDRKDLHRALEAVTGGEIADQVELVAQRADGKLAQGGGIRERLLEVSGHFRRIKDEREKFLKVFGLHLPGEEALDQRAEL